MANKKIPIIEKEINVHNAKATCPFCGIVNEVQYNINENKPEGIGEVHCVHIAYVINGIAMFRNVPHIM